MSAYLGGLAVVSLQWASPRALVCRFTSTHTSRWHHLYAGRTLVGSCAPGQRLISAQLLPARYPEHLTLAAVDLADRLTDFGDRLPLRPFNRVRLRFTAASFPADTEFLDVTAGTEPGGAVDAGNRIGRLLFAGDRQYEFLSPPLAGGEWNFTITPRDNRPSGGNAGTPANATQTVLAHPPDVEISGGDRLAVAIAGGFATISATIPAD